MYQQPNGSPWPQRPIIYSNIKKIPNKLLCLTQTASPLTSYSTAAKRLNLRLHPVETKGRRICQIARESKLRRHSLTGKFLRRIYPAGKQGLHLRAKYSIIKTTYHTIWYSPLFSYSLPPKFPQQKIWRTKIFRAKNFNVHIQIPTYTKTNSQYVYKTIAREASVL